MAGKVVEPRRFFQRRGRAAAAARSRQGSVAVRFRAAAVLSERGHHKAEDGMASLPVLILESLL
jgi:hypothetical protein